MLTETFQSIATAARKVFRNWQSTLLLAVVYAALLAALYFFVAVREASIAQVALTFALAIVAPVLFFILQAMVASDSDELTVASLLRRSLSGFWKLLLITLPLIALAVLIAYLLGKAQAHFGTNVNEAAQFPRPMAATARARDATRPIDWRAALLSTVRYLAFGVILPLAAIHLWIATANEGLALTLKKSRNYLARAFAPQSVLIYTAGFVIFGLVPYLLLFKTTTSEHAWIEISLFVARLVVVFALTLLGWAITVKALALLSTHPPSDHANEAV